MKLTIEDKCAHVAAWRNSGLTQRQYSELHQINLHTFKSWVQLLKKTVTDSKASPSPELAAVENSVTLSSSKALSDIIPVKVAPQGSVDDVRLDNFTHPSPQLQPQAKHPNLECSSGLLAVSEIKPLPPEVSLILTSGLQIKCDVRLLSQVLQVVEHA